MQADTDSLAGLILGTIALDAVLNAGKAVGTPIALPSWVVTPHISPLTLWQLALHTGWNTLKLVVGRVKIALPGL